MTVDRKTIETAAASAEEFLNVPATEFIEVIKSGAVKAYKSFSPENNTKAVKAEFQAERLQLCEAKSGEPIAIDEELETAITQSVELLLALLKEKVIAAEQDKEKLEREKALRLEEEKRKLKEQSAALLGKVQLAKIKGKDEASRTIQLELGNSISGEIREEDALKDDWQAADMIPVMVTAVIRSEPEHVLSCNRRSKEVLAWLLQSLPIGQIKAVARQAGVRSMVAVQTDKPIDDLKRETQSELAKVSAALSGETIEFVEWDSDTSRWIANCFSAEISLEDITIENGEARVIVEPASEESALLQVSLISSLAGLPIKIKKGKATENLPGIVT